MERVLLSTIEANVTNDLGYNPSRRKSSYESGLSLQIHLGRMDSATGNDYDQDLYSMMDMSSAIDSAGVTRYVNFQEPSEVIDALEEFKIGNFSTVIASVRYARSKKITLER